MAAGDEGTNYALGSVLNHVCLHQTVIGQEAIAQMEMAGEEPDVVVGCVGGGSNFAGLTFPFVRRVLRGEAKTRFLAAEPAACPTLTRGAYRYDFGDTVGLTPLMPMYTLGHDFVPPPVHAGGLRYHGDSPMLCGLVKHGLVEARAYKQNETFAAALRFARTEGIIPGPEPAHAIRAVIEEAEAAKQAGEERVILLGLSGHGHFDMSAYESYLAGQARGPGVLGGGHGSGARAPAGRAGDRLDALLALARRLRDAAARGTGSGSGGVLGSSVGSLLARPARPDAAPLRGRRPRLGLAASPTRARGRPASGRGRARRARRARTPGRPRRARRAAEARSARPRSRRGCP